MNRAGYSRALKETVGFSKKESVCVSWKLDQDSSFPDALWHPLRTFAAS